MTPNTDRFSRPLPGEGRDYDREQDIEDEKADMAHNLERDDE